MSKSLLGMAAGAGLLLSIFSVGCASTSIQSNGPVYTGQLPRPEMILVYPFATSQEDVQLDSSPTMAGAWKLKGISASTEANDVGHAVASKLADRLVEKIQTMGLPAARAYGPPEPGAGSVMTITGQFMAIDQGNRLERLTIGLGAGRSTVTAEVQVSSVSAEGRRMLDEFEVIAKSGRKPGAAETIGVGAAAGTVATAAAVTAATAIGSEAFGANVDDDAGRAADKIAGMLRGFFAQNGWIAPQ